MSIESMRQYTVSKPLSVTTTQLIRNSQEESIIVPNVQELLSIKADLEAILPISKNRVEDLKNDLILIENPIVQDSIIDSATVKLESDDELFIPKDKSSSKQNNVLETMKWKRKQQVEQARRSESPQVKKTEIKTHGKLPPSQMKRKKQEEELDFVRVKSKDQVPLATFWTSIDPYFRLLTEQDREILLEKSDVVKPFLIPPLGEHYLEQWKREDKILQISSPKEQSTPIPRANPESLSDRLLSSLISEDIIDSSELTEEEEGAEIYRCNTESDIVDFEERLKRELYYAGLLKSDDVGNLKPEERVLIYIQESWNAKEDDEICAEIRALGREYKDQVKINESRKKKLLEIVDQQLQFEQYRTVLDTLDKQVEQGYIKRFRNQKSKKSASKSGKSVLSENAAYAAEKRKTWTNALGEIFKDKNLIMPSETIYSQKNGY